MALHQLTPFPFCTHTRLPPSGSSLLGLSRNGHLPCQVRCMVAAQPTDQTIVRRSANYQTPIWEYDFVQSLKSEYAEESYKAQANKLKGEVRMMLDKALHPLDQLQLIDTLQRLGLAYHFEEEIRTILKSIHNNSHKKDSQMIKEDNLYVAALEFRLLRQHGYNVPQEVFNIFKDDDGNFKVCLCNDIKGMLYLYEASYLLVDGESVLEDARSFVVKYLKEYVKHNKDQYLSMLVSHALELPLHWRMPRMEARWFIDAYGRRQDMNPVILELAKLDFNMVQAKHQEDVKHASRWWSEMDLGNKLTYTRDRVMENALWAVGQLSEPQFEYFRKMITRVNALITTLDDAYDVYGTLEELELFTDVVKRWDINAMERLPYYMKISFFALYNTVHEMAFVALKEKGINAVPYLKKLWGDLCGVYLQEAKWYYGGYHPTLQEYLDNAWLSISGPVIIAHGFFFLPYSLSEEASKSVVQYPNIFRHASMILRLANDLGTSSDEIARGDVPKSIQCYMHETGATEGEAREKIRNLIDMTWKKLNKEFLFSKSPYSQTFVESAVNLARSALCFYQFGDGYGIQDRETKDRLMSLFVQPISLINNNKAF